MPRALADLQRNVTSAIASLAAELADFHGRLGELEASAGARDAVCLARLASDPAGASPSAAGNGSRLGAPQPLLAREGAPQQLEQRMQARGGEAGQEEGAGLGLRAMAAELAELRAVVERSSRREFAMVCTLELPSYHPQGSVASHKYDNCQLPRCVVVVYHTLLEFTGVAVTQW